MKRVWRRGAAAAAAGLLALAGCGGTAPDAGERARPEGAIAAAPRAPGDALVCTDCHGLPPATGAHLAHASLDGYRFGYDCSTCHYVERFPDLHDNGTVEVRFSPTLARFPGAGTGRYQAGTCSDVYCHSSAYASEPGGGIRYRPVAWADGTALGCDGCHDDHTSAEVRMSGRHELHLNMGVECAHCHQGVVALDGRIIDHDRHVDGRVDVAILHGDYEPLSGTCTPGCHVVQLWFGQE